MLTLLLDMSMGTILGFLSSVGED